MAQTTALRRVAMAAVGLVAQVAQVVQVAHAMAVTSLSSSPRECAPLPLPIPHRCAR
ncbi:MAG: hypothetical protein J6V31_00550 [Tidjanibacter sp.]|nr:hypothetical protein [Tidjanibacter sp.]